MYSAGDHYSLFAQVLHSEFWLVLHVSGYPQPVSIKQPHIIWPCRARMAILMVFWMPRQGLLHSLIYITSYTLLITKYMTFTTEQVLTAIKSMRFNF